MNNRIVFISHDASLTGAPVLLINLMRLLKQQEKTRFSVILMRGGDLEDEFRKIAKVYVVKHARYGKRSSRFLKFADFIALQFKMIPVYFIVFRAHLIFNNTIANGRVIKQLRFLGVPVLTYIHELKTTIEAFQKNKDASYTLKYSNLFASPSGKVTDTLVKDFGINQKLIFPLDYFFPSIPSVKSNDEKFLLRQQFANRFEVDINDFWVVGMGTATPRKGIDLFVKICSQVISQSDNISFIWIGEFLDVEFKAKIEAETQNLGIGKKLVFTGKLPNSQELLTPFNLFLLTSREDPYPLVVLEAAYHSIPSACFEQSGGISEFVESDAGWLISDFSLEEMSKVVLYLAKNSQELESKGAKAKEKVIARHSDKERITRQLENALQHLKMYKDDQSTGK